MRFNQFWKILQLFLIFSLSTNFQLISFDSFSHTSVQSITNSKSIIELTNFSYLKLAWDHPNITSNQTDEYLSFLYIGDLINNSYAGEHYIYVDTNLFQNFFFSTKVFYRMNHRGQITIGIDYLTVVGIESLYEQPSRCFTYARPFNYFISHKGSTIPPEGFLYFQIERQDNILRTKILNAYNNYTLLFYSWGAGVSSPSRSFKISFSANHSSNYAKFTDLYISYDYGNIDTTTPSSQQTITLGYDSYLAVFLICLSFLVLIIRNRTKTRTKI